MAVQVGDTVYLWCHAYLRYIGRVTAILGQRRVSLEQASLIHDDSGGYEGFFADGVTSRTNYSFINSVKDVGYVSAHDFPHELPSKRRNK